MNKIKSAERRGEIKIDYIIDDEVVIRMHSISKERKNKMLKKIIAILMVLLMIVPMMFSCAKDEEPDVENGTDDQGNVATVDGTDVTDDIGERDYGGRKVTVGMNGDTKNLFYIDQMTGKMLDDSIYKRNKIVEERLNIALDVITYTDGGNYGLVNNITNNVLAGSLDFDFTYSNVWTMGMLVPKKMLRDLGKVDEIDLAKPYWSKLANEAMRIGDAYPMLTGDAALELYRNAWVVTINKDMLETQSDYPDLYSVVKEGKWTLEYLRVLSSKYYSDIGVEGETDEKDILGFASGNSVFFDPYFTSSGLSALKRDDGGFLYYDFDMGAASDALDEVMNLLNASSTYVYTVSSMLHETVAEKFADGEAFSMSAILKAFEFESMVDMENKYIILPFPKAMETQDNYYTDLRDSYYVYAAPISVSDDDIGMIGAVLEVLSSTAYNNVKPIYYEKLLKTRIADDPKNAEMIDLLMANVRIDSSTPYKLSITELWRDVIKEAHSNKTAPVLASTFTSQKEREIFEKLDGENGLNNSYINT